MDIGIQIKEPRITFGMIVLNGVPFLRYNLRALYPFAHQIIVVEGACPSAQYVATPKGHSRDTTIETIQTIMQEEDPEKKIYLVTAEDEGHTDGFWSEKDEMSEAYAKRATGNYLWQIDVDEFYLQKDMETVIQWLREDPSITAISFPMKTFSRGLEYLVDGYLLGRFFVNRLFAWDTGYRYVNHRPPTVVNENGVCLHSKNAINAFEMKRKRIFMYHYEQLFPKQVEDKCSYYKGAAWLQSLHNLEQWMKNSYFSLKKPFRVHMVYEHISWMEKNYSPHPPQITAMLLDVQNGKYPEINLRNNSDAEKLLKNPFYIMFREILKAFFPAYCKMKDIDALCRSQIKKSFLWPVIKRIIKI
jgi:hypothetical protein